MTADESDPKSAGEILLYQTEDGRTRIQCRLEEETLWLTQAQMAELFQIGVGTVNHHLKAIYDDRELRPEATIRRHRIVRNEGNREVSRIFFNLRSVMVRRSKPRPKPPWGGIP